MDAVSLILTTAFFAFVGGWYFGRDARFFGVAVLATGIGGAFAQNPFPADGGVWYGYVSMALFFGGLAMLALWMLVQVQQKIQDRRTPTNAT